MHRLPALLAALVAGAAAHVAAAPPAAAASALQFGRIYYDSPGSDTRTNSSLNAEYFVIRNTAAGTRCLTGWTVRDKANHVYDKFGSFCLAGGRSVTVHTGRGTNTASHRYWGGGNYVWNNDGDRAYLRNRSGTLMDSCSFGASADYVYC